MLRLLRYLMWLFARFVVSLRYRVKITGMERLKELRGPVLILPNHPAYMDPVVVLTMLWGALRPRPMMFASNFANPLLYPIMKLLNALEVPDLERASRRARRQAEEAVQKLIAGLRAGHNHILWPSGRLERTGEEVLGSARALGDILEACPDATFLLVRTRGLFGSMFSYAQTGKAPELVRLLLRGVGYLFANLLFFMPRRPVSITLEPLDRSQLPTGDRRQINAWFEDWYNRGGPEKPTYVPYHFLFGRRDFVWPTVDAAEGVDLQLIRPETRAEVNELLCRKLKRNLNEAELQPETTLDQLGLDSLDRMDLTQQIEQRFGFSADEVPINLGQLWALAQGLAQKGPVKPTPPQWFKPPSDTAPVVILGETVVEALVARALRCRRDVVVADDLSGVLTYEKLLVGALTLARRLRELPGDNVGLLLPASVASDVALLALHLAGKLPVVLNWTTGQANLEYSARTVGLQRVVTSETFLDRIDLADLPGVEWVFLEDIRKTVGKLEQLTTLLGVRCRPGRVRAAVPARDPDQPAVVLFTSGSEKAPKAVPLTHRNLIANMRASAAALRFTRTDSILGFLPAFHSFGMTVTGLLPLLFGLRVVRHPDPTDANGLVRKAAAYRTTLMASTPTFLSFLFERAKDNDLASLWVVVVGAEKCPQAVFDQAKRVAPRAHLLEGYGITECSPVVSVNPPDAIRPGTVGKPLPGIEVCAVGLESGAPLPSGQQGMLLVSGPTVFPGYLAYEGAQPFRELDGKKWYITGDLAVVDADGYIHFAGRLKRVLKVGGEMVSLPALEEPFARKFPPDKEGPQVAVEGIEQENGRRIVLFTRVPLTLEQANDLLEAEGFRGVMRLTEVQVVKAIPVLGTGKTDYKVLRTMLESPAPV